ncbi:MAG: TldD/PmbA family protein [Gemmatimonadales bacterium]|nr:TldD/PmbA family protein [Gemmatimonadales bacterium]
MALLTEAQARAIAEKVLKLSKAETCSLAVGSSEESNVRTARGAVSTAGTTRNTTLGVTVTFGKRSGTSSTNDFDDASLERCVRKAEELARLAPEDPEYMPPIGPQEYQRTPAWSDRTAAFSADDRARFAKDAVDACKAADCVGAGFYVQEQGSVAVANSNGLFGFHRQTRATFTITSRTRDELGSGFATQDAIDVAGLDAQAAARIASEKAKASREAKAIEPGKYTVVMEPAALVDLLQPMVGGMDARTADEGRSFLSKRGGGTRLGEKLVDERITIVSDPMDPVAAAGPWAGGGGGGGFFGGGGSDGRARGRTVFIENGVVKNLAYSRYWAQKQGVAGVPGPANMIFNGGTASLEDLIRGTQRGILVTRTWYIRPVDPRTLLYTGLTRDGTFYIEDGQIKHAVKNLRFNESPVIMLNNLDEMGKPVRVRNTETFLPAVVPPMRIRDFTFSSLSDAV